MRTGADEARSPKYSHVERERRFLVDRARLSALPQTYVLIEDRYIVGTRLRLRRMTDSATGEVALKLAKKYKADDPLAPPMVNAYLSGGEYDLLISIPAHRIVKRRYQVATDDRAFSVDIFEGALAGLVLAEIECATATALATVTQPDWAVREVSDDPDYHGGALAKLHALRHQRIDQSVDVSIDN